MSVADVVRASKAFLEAKTAAQAADQRWRDGDFSSDAYNEMVRTERVRSQAETVALAALADIQHDGIADDARIARLRIENLRQADQIRKLRKELTDALRNNRERNRELDALHYVWCDGGCTGGTHRFCGSPSSITEDDVQTIERCARRLRRWFTIYQSSTRYNPMPFHPTWWERLRIWIARKVYP